MSVTLPVFVTVMVKLAVPPLAIVCESGPLLMPIAGFWSAGTSSLAQAWVAPVAFTQAVLA